MKKLYIILGVFVFLFICLFLLLFSHNRTLECTFSEDYDDIKIRNKIEFNFKNHTYKQIDKMTFKDEKDAASYFKDISDYIEEYNLKLDKNSIISEIKKSFSEDSNRKKLKEKYESYDYKCR